MCSTLEAQLARLRAAIDEVALAARAGPAGRSDAATWPSGWPASGHDRGT